MNTMPSILSLYLIEYRIMPSWSQWKNHRYHPSCNHDKPIDHPHFIPITTLILIFTMLSVMTSFDRRKKTWEVYVLITILLIVTIPPLTSSPLPSSSSSSSSSSLSSVIIIILTVFFWWLKEGNMRGFWSCRSPWLRLIVEEYRQRCKYLVG